MSNKRFISMLLVVALFFSILPVQQVFAYPDTKEEFLQYLGTIGQPLKNSALLDANFKTYQKYNLIIYGDTWGEIKSSRVTNRDEPRYLGWTVDNKPYTNTFFPNDDRGTTSPLYWDYKPVAEAYSSWLGKNDDAVAYMKSTNLGFIDEIDKNKLITYNGLTVGGKIGETNARLQNIASWKNGFSVYTLHEGANGKVYYATLYGPAMGKTSTGEIGLNCAISTPANTYTIKADQTQVTVPVTVTATANLVGAYVKATQIKELTASFEDSKKQVAGVTTAATTKNKVFNRSQYAPGTYTVTLTGTADMQSTLSGADKYTKQATKNITLIVEGNPNAYVEVTATANPTSKQVDGSKDELVTVTVNASLKNYTDTTNIKSWTIYAKLDGEDATLQTKSNPGSVLNSTASFTFTVVKSKFNLNNFIQQIKATAVVSLNRAIVGELSYQGTNYTKAEFYKVPTPVVEDPPLPGNLPPVAVLYADETIIAGDETTIDASDSYDTDGTIASYTWNTTGATLVNTGGSNRTVWYPYTGQAIKTYKASVKVKDNGGASDTESKTITVLEPTVEAKIKATGKLKVNRSVKLSNVSDTPMYYPLNNNLTVWTLQAVSGGTNADIKFNGVLAKVNELNLIFKKAGVYKATLRVTNTAGFTDTTEYTINIGPDLAPVANYSVTTTVIRDVEDYGNAAIELQDTSYSLDGDTINSRIWTYAFDSDNDGLFTDETYKTIDNGNNTKPTLKVSTVGKYHIKLSVKENFTDTIPLYILPTDYLSDDTAGKPAAESIVEVINIAPTAAFSMIDKKKVDLVFNVWDTNYTKEQIETKINSTLVPALNENDIDANITLADNYDVNTLNSDIDMDHVSYAWDENPNWRMTTNDIVLPAGYNKFSYVSTQQSSYGSYGWFKVNGDVYNVNSNMFETPSRAYVRLYNTSTNSYTDIATIRSDNYKDISSIIFGNYTATFSDGTFGADTASMYFVINDFVAEGNKITINASGFYHASGNGKATSQYLFQNIEQTFIIPGTLGSADRYQFKTYSNIEKREKDSRLTGHVSFHGEGTLISKTDNSKYLTTLLSEQSFRENSQPYVVTISHSQLEELTDPERAATVLSQTLEKNVNFVGLGTASNKVQLENYIKSNNNNGTFVDNTNLDTAIASLKDYILGIENQEEPKTQYVVKGEELEYLTFYDDYEDDVKYAEQWKYTHSNPNYFDNGLGTDAQSGINRTTPITQFSKVGVYDVLYRVRDNPYNNSLFDNYRLWSEDAPTQFIVHRRPIAAFTPYVLYNGTTSKYYASTVDKSYDSDHSVSRADKGIVAKQWNWKTTDAAVWKSGTPTDMLYGKAYQIQLMVQDMEGAWSLPLVQTVTVPEILVYANPPSLPWQNMDVDVNLAAKINAGTFSRIEYKWTNSTAKPTTGFTSTTSANNNLTQTTAGEWYLHATAYTTGGQSAYNYFGPYQIDKIAPTITTSKIGGVSGADVTVNATITDTGGSGVKDVKYRWTNTTTKPTSGWTVTSGSFSTTQNQNVLMYLHIEATDNAGNVTYTRYNLPYIALIANPTSLPWRNTNAVVNLATAVTNGTFSKVDYRWTNSTTKPTTGLTSSTSTNFNTTLTTTGIWYLHATAFLTDGQSKYAYFGSYQIDKIAPTITADLTNADGSDPVTVNVTLADTGGSGIRDVKYKWTNTTTKPTTGWTATASSFSSTQNLEGTWYLHVEVSDNAGNVTYGYLGTYKINTFKLEGFRVVMVRDIQLEGFYKNPTQGLGKLTYIDKPMYANSLAVDTSNFDGATDGLTKGYRFEFEIDSTNFNEYLDSIVFTPKFYTCDAFIRDTAERDVFWEDSNHRIYKAGEG
ncbi:MAG: hypothetical protein A2Y23_15510, partial [Clostridiales bacterium GWB2_37_7]